MGVQLAIQKRKILVYHRKMLKSTSSAMPTETTTTNADGGKEEAEEVKDFYELCRVLFKMLARYPSGLRLDRMKRVMKDEFGFRLNEMSFQCTKLIELFKKEPLDSTFLVISEKKAFTVKL